MSDTSAQKLAGLFDYLHADGTATQAAYNRIVTAMSETLNNPYQQPTFNQKTGFNQAKSQYSIPRARLKPCRIVPIGFVPD
jgi:glutathionyl-hydroquinone reductase